MATSLFSCIAAEARSRRISVRSTFEPGDYSVVPRAVTYRVVPETQDNFFLIIQSRTEFEPPEKGLIGHHALYDPGVVTVPEPDAHLDDQREWEVRIKVDDEISKVFYPFNPLDVVGWKGDLTVWKLNMRDIRPIMSHRAHLPPSAHSTFVTEGAVVCSFLPRPLEQDEDALSVPFFHRNTDYDEFIFYHDGDFFSKDNIKPRVRHAPSARHSSRPASQSARQPRQEDPYRRIRGDARRVEPHSTCCPPAKKVEWKDYWASWQEKK